MDDGRNLPVLAEPVPEARVIERRPVEPMPLSAAAAASAAGAAASSSAAGAAR
jgi:hypothetical protein